MSKLISVCMIVKNEEEVLPRCFESLKGLWDELVIVDTGSTDRTVEIAREFGAKVIHYDWIAPGHKGDARNYGIDAATGEWIVIIDADEVLIDAKGARAIIEGSQSNDAISVLFHNYIDGQITLSWQQVRIFRKGTHRYQYREHEVPVSFEPGRIAATSSIAIEHRSPNGRSSGKSAPMMARLALDVEDNPNDPHPLYFLHRECLNQKEYERCIELGNQYLDLTCNGGFIQAEIHANLGSAYANLGSHVDACKHMHLAAACEPNKREWLYRLAVLYMQQQAWNVCLAYCRAAAELTPVEDRQWEPQVTAKIYDLIGVCQRNLAHSH